MEAKEKLERAGWLYVRDLEYHLKIYRRGCLRIIYSDKENRPVAVYNIFEGNFRMVDDLLFEFLCEKEV